MIGQTRMLCMMLLTLLMVSCEVSTPQTRIAPIGGREPEVITWISGQQWFPATIGILVNEEAGYIYLEANSSENKGYKRVLRLNIINEEMEWLPLEPLDLWETDLPTRVTAEYKQFRDKDNVNASRWLADENSRGGLRISGIETEEGVTYAAGEFFMSPYVANDRPDVQEIEGLFNNIRVFETRDEMTAYFNHVTELEAASN